MTIDRLSPAVRMKLVSVKQDAMRVGSASVLTQLVDYFRHPILTPHERFYLAMAAAEVAYLDGNLDAALSFMEPGSTGAAPSRDLRVVLFDNRLMVRLLRPQTMDGNESRRNWDEKELRTSGQYPSAELLDALRAARADKHFDALPQLRSCLVHAHWSGDWRLFREAASELSRELLILRDFAGSAYCAMLACDEEAVVATATACAATGTSASVRSALILLMEFGHLRQQARIVCCFVKAVADAVPDDLVDVVVEYLLNWVLFRREFMTPLNVGTAAWEALGTLGARVSRDLADKSINVALGADAWRGHAIERELLVKANAELVLKCSDDMVRVLTEKATALARPEERSHDYQSVLHLLWQISTRSSQARAVVVAEVFPVAAPVPASLLQLARLLEIKMSQAEELDSLASRLASQIRRQVVLLNPGEDEPPAEGFGKFTFAKGDKKVVVQLSHFGPVLEGVLGYATELSDHSVNELVTALTEMIASPFNIVANKSELVHYLGRFAEQIQRSDFQSAWNVLRPLARGEIVDTAEHTTMSASDPLNPFRMNVGSVGQLQAAAIVALAKLDKSHSGIATAEIQSMVASGLAETDSVVRRNSCIAASWLSTLSGSIVTGLLVATRDGAADAAAAALRVLASIDPVNLDGAQMDYLIQAIHAASQSGAGVLRSAAATAASRLMRGQLSDSQQGSLNGIVDLLEDDPLYSVRSQLFADRQPE